MEKFIIEGGIPLSGEVTPSGNKNAALPLMAACLLTDEPVTLHNMPNIRDVINMRDLIQSLGVFCSSNRYTLLDIPRKKCSSCRFGSGIM